MKFMLIFLGFVCVLNANYVPFDEGFLRFPSNLPCIKEFTIAYEKNHFRHVKADQKIRIPKIVHHVWLGSKLPKAYKHIVDSWKTHHPEWEHRLWTDADIGTFPLVTGNIIHNVQNLGQRSDILRLEILNHYGGLYVDTDFLCLKPHDEIHKCCDFYAGFHGRTVYNSLMGSIPHHPIVTQYLDAINQHSVFSPHHREIIKVTGPSQLTEIACNYITKKQDDVIFFPPIYHYPFSPNARFRYWAKNQNFSIVKPYITKYAYAVHLWACSWVHPKQAPKKK